MSWPLRRVCATANPAVVMRRTTSAIAQLTMEVTKFREASARFRNGS